MKKITIFLLLFFTTIIVQAQVGINTTVPNAQLDIRSSNQATPTNTDGILIPKVDVFPATNPTAVQQGMLVYLTTTSGAELPGFYYWDNATVDWKPITGTTGVTLDQAYDFGGAGNGKTITADAGAVLINGTDGIHSTGILNSGSTLPISGAGVKMLWYPRKAAFRAGRATSTQWDDTNIGLVSTAFGSGTTASATNSTAFGTGTTASNTSAIAFGLSSTASGDTSTAFGSGSTASGQTSAAFGINTIASGATSTAFGSSSMAIGQTSTVFGINNGAESYGETVIGIRATPYTPSPNGATQFRLANATDRLFVIGNAIDLNNNGTADATEESDAMIVLKNGLTRLPSTTNAMITAADGKAVVTKEYMQSNNWSLIGNTGTNSTTNFIGTTDNVDLIFKRGNTLSGRIGNSTTFFGRMSGSVSTGTNNTYIGTEAGRDNVTGQQNVFIGRRAGTFGATGSDNILIGNGAGIFNEANQNSFVGSFSGNGTSTGANNTFMGYSSGIATSGGSQNAFFGASAGSVNTAGIGNTILGTNANVASNNLTNASAIGFNATVGASNSLVLGSINGINSATSSVNVGIGTTTPLDRLHIVGNIRMVDGNQAAGRVLTSDVNGVATWQNASANAWGLLGNAGTNATTNFIGTTDNVDLVFRRGNIISGRLGDSNTFFGRNSGVVATGTSNTFIGERTGIANVSGSFNTFLGRLAGANGASGNDNTYLGYAAGLNNTSNGNLVLGAFAAQNTSGNFNVFIGTASGSNNTTGTRNTILGYSAEVGAANLSNATAIGNLAQVDASNSLVLGSITGVNGSSVSTNVGIGTTTPSRRLHVSTGVSGGTPNGNGDFVLESNGAVYGHLLAPSANETGLLFGSELSSIHAGIICNNVSNPNGFQFRTGGNTTRMVVTNAGDVGIGTATPGGQFQLSLDEGRKPGTNTWTIASDQRLKTINGNYTKGLNEILQLNPIRFNYKNVGERTFEKEVLDTEFPGFIAQEVQPLFPDAVGTDVDGFLNFNIHPILIASVNAIKELNAKNESLQTENESLKTELNQQKAALESVLRRLTQLEQK